MAALNGGVSCNTSCISRRLCDPYPRARREEWRQASQTTNVYWEVQMCKRKWLKMGAPGAGRAGQGCTTTQGCTVSSPIFLQRGEMVLYQLLFWWSVVCPLWCGVSSWGISIPNRSDCQGLGGTCTAGRPALGCTAGPWQIAEGCTAAEDGRSLKSLFSC